MKAGAAQRCPRQAIYVDARLLPLPHLDAPLRRSPPLGLLAGCLLQRRLQRGRAAQRRVALAGQALHQGAALLQALLGASLRWRRRRA